MSTPLLRIRPQLLFSRQCTNIVPKPRVLPALPRLSTCRSVSTESAAPSTSSTTSSVSQNEVSHFTKLASSWWDPHGPSRLLHLMNPLRHDFIQSCLQSDPDFSPETKLDYLDIGCGGGIFATSAARLAHTGSVTAIDPTPSVIQVAKAKQRSDPNLSEPKLTYLNCAIEDLDIQGTKEMQSDQSKDYNVITLFEVIEHISQPAAFLATALKHLKPGGWLVGSTIARHPIAYVTTKLVAEAPLVGIVPQGTHDWNQYINPEELTAWFTRQNDQARMEGRSTEWADVKIRGVVYVPVLGWKWVNGSEKYGNYFFGVQKLHADRI